MLQISISLYSNLRYVFFDKLKYRKYLKKNLILKNCAKKEICYILGNGPSLKNVDISLLKGKDVITVNKSINTPFFEQLTPKAHIVLDKKILSSISDDIELKLQNNNMSTHFIFHRSGIEQFKSYRNTFFAYATKMAYPKIKNDMCSNMTTYLNVLPFAIACAMYMGYKKIVLLGNDFSFFAARKDQHFYDIEENVKRQESLYQDLAGCSIVLTEYRNLYKYAKKQGVKIVNATEGSLLDEIPQVNLLDCLE